MTPELRHTLTDGVLRLEGVLGRQHARALGAVLTRARPKAGSTLTLDLSQVDEIDSAIVAVLVDGWRRIERAGGALRLGPVSDGAQRALSMFRLAPELPAGGPPPGLFEGMGGGLLSGAGSLRDLAQLTADTSAVILRAILRPRLIRWGAVLDQSIYIGSQALPIVGLITFLVGLTLAFQSAYQLRQFGASIFVANLTGVAMLREMGPLMTAILVAGRSGSSIAAEISTMQVSEEIDALRVMGLDPVAFLAVPRVVAITLVMPLLTVLADLLGTLGGFLVGVFYLEIAPTAFLNQLLDALTVGDLLTGIVKSFAFAWGIALIGLFYGFRVRGGAGEVGRTTTASVVASIFYIIVADCVFSVLFFVVV